MNKMWDKENSQLFFLLIICFFSVYYLPTIVSQVFFAGIILYVFRTKNDYFWLVCFFVLIDAPGRLFSSSGGTSMRLPLYTITSGISMGFQELFTWAYLLKTIFRNDRLAFAFTKQFRWFYFFGVGILIYSLILQPDFSIMLVTYRLLLPWAWVFILPFYIRDEGTLFKVSKLLFPLIFLVLASQISMYFIGSYWDSLYNSSAKMVEDISSEGEAMRSGSSAFILLFCTIQCFFYLLAIKPPFKRNYLIILIFTCMLSVFLSATRGWIIAFIVLLTGIILFTSTRTVIQNSVRVIAISIFLFSILQFVFPVIGDQIDNSLLRLSTMGKLAEGDMTAGGTLSRLTSRGPAVMKMVWQNPVLGWGFTRDYFENADGHVGNQNIMLNVGITGFVVLLIIYISIFLKIWRQSIMPSIVAHYGLSLRVYAIGMLAIFIIHSSSTQFWGYIMTGSPQQKPLFYAFFLTAVNVIIMSNKASIRSVIKT